MAPGGSSHALPSRVGWSDESSGGDPPAAQQPKPKAKGRAAKKSKAKKNQEPPEDDPDPILDGAGDDDDDDEVDPLGGDDEAPTEPVSKKPATKRDVKKRPAGAGRSKGSKQSKAGMGWELEIACLSTHCLPNKHLLFFNIENKGYLRLRILLDQSFSLNLFIFIQDDDDALPSPKPFEYAIEKKHRFGEGFISQNIFRSLCFP